MKDKKMLKGVKTFESSSSSSGGSSDDVNRDRERSKSSAEVETISEDHFDKVLDRRSNSDHDNILMNSFRLRENLVSEKPINLNEPQIYANRLLGMKINTKDRIVMKNIDGKLQRTI